MVRTVTAADEPRLRHLARLCPMRGPVSYTLEREPDFFALTRLQGPRHVVVACDAEDGGLAAMGTAVVAPRYLAGRVTDVGYLADLKVRPDHRGRGLAGDVLRHAARELASRELCAFAVVLAGNAAMARIVGGDGLRFRRRATVRKHSTFLLHTPSMPEGHAVRRARRADVDTMCTLWTHLRSGRDLSIAADGLFVAIEPEAFLVVERGGEIVAFGAPWDAAPVRQVRLDGLSPGLRALRRVYNPVAAVLGRPRMPRDGEPLVFVSLLHTCAETPGDLRALLVGAHRALAGTRALYLDLSLDVDDPLTPALAGFLRTHVDFDVYRVGGPVGDGVVGVDLGLS